MPLLAVANKGAATAAQLRDDVRRQRLVLAQDNINQPVSWSDQALAIASRIVSVQKVEGAMSMTPPALVTRMDMALQSGDIQAALAAWQALPEPARRTSEILGLSMTQRVAADSAIRAISDTAVQSLSAAPAAR